MKNNQKGFSAVEAILVVVVLGIVGGTAWYVIRANKDVDKMNAATVESSTSAPSTSKKKSAADSSSQPSSSTAQNDKAAEVVSEDIMVCSVNTAAPSGGGLKIAFYGYVKGDSYSKVWVEFGANSDKLDKKTVEFPNGADDCAELLAHMPAADLTAGKYFYRVAASKSDGTTVYSKTDTFTKD